MDENQDKYELPSSWMIPPEPPSREGHKTFNSGDDASV